MLGYRRPREPGAGVVLPVGRQLSGRAAGRPDELAEAGADVRRAADSLGQPWHHYFAGCVAQGRAFCDGDFEQAEQRAEATLRLGEAFGVDTTDGSYGVQMFMIRRETGRLDVARRLLTGRESFAGRWAPGCSRCTPSWA